MNEVSRVWKGENNEQLYESGIVDPTKVCRVALENAASVAGLLLTTEAVVCEMKETESVGSKRGHENLDY